ncbi:VOC family protein [Microlunatus speluncae]|uniref:VOC family protein n=1 Tax=Microlunatus speluncae TaxID=2594267 RepID=UPI0012664700|nr:VOC family protein [Microlunatus speluncae]
MTSNLNPYLNFDGNALEALEFYREVLGGELKTNTFGEFGNDDAAVKDKIMHGQLTSAAGYTLMAADIMPGMEFRQGTTMTISISGDDADQLRGYFKQLAEGGTVSVELAKQPWGDEFGMCTDRYGVSWMVDIYPAS